LTQTLDISVEGAKKSPRACLEIKTRLDATVEGSLVTYRRLPPKWASASLAPVPRNAILLTQNGLLQKEHILNW